MRTWKKLNSSVNQNFYDVKGLGRGIQFITLRIEFNACWKDRNKKFKGFTVVEEQVKPDGDFQCQIPNSWRSVFEYAVEKVDADVLLVTDPMHRKGAAVRLPDGSYLRDYRKPDRCNLVDYELYTTNKQELFQVTHEL